MSRRALDKYLTPDWATRALVRAYPRIGGDLLVDPCSGDGRMAASLAADGRFKRAVLNDIDPSAPADLHVDAADSRIYAHCGEAPDWIISNPPFSAAGDIVWAALSEPWKKGVAMLLRCTFGEPCASKKHLPRIGRQWLKDWPPSAVLMLPRISFTGDGSSDSAPCWWFVWVAEHEAHRYRNRCIGRAEAAGQRRLNLEA